MWMNYPHCVGTNAQSPAIHDSFSKADLEYVTSRVLAKCDSLDGAVDGLIQDQAACATAFVPATDLAAYKAAVTPKTIQSTPRERV